MVAPLPSLILEGPAHWLLDEEPQWVWIREDASGSYIELRLDKEYGYVLNIIQGEFEQYDFELGGIENAITIQQIN